MKFFLESSDRNCTRNIIYSTVNAREHCLERIATVAVVQRAGNTRSTSSSSENMQWDIRKIKCCEDQISDYADLEKQLDNIDGNLKKSRDEAWKAEKAAVKEVFKKERGRADIIKELDTRNQERQGDASTVGASTKGNQDQEGFTEHNRTGGP